MRQPANVLMASFAIAITTLATLSSALAAEGSSGAKETTMTDLLNKIDALSGTVGNLATANATAHATLAAKVDALANQGQVAVVMTVPNRLEGGVLLAGGTTQRYTSTYYLVGDSSIPGFPAGTLGANGLFAGNTLDAGSVHPAVRMPAGTYLFELQPPYSDNALCNRRVSVRQGLDALARQHRVACPRIYLVTSNPHMRLEDGFVVRTFTATSKFRVAHYFPPGWTFTSAKPLRHYAGAVKITRLK